MGTWTTTTDHSIPTEWNVSTGSNVLWKTVLPEGGQSGIAVWEDRLFLTINKPLPEGTPLEKAEGSDIIAYCLDTNTGKVLWTRDIPSPKTMPYSGLFSDNTSATPVTDGKHVWFINHGGLMVCYDMDGNEVWKRAFESRTRHNAKQAEPILVDNQLLFVLMRDPCDPKRRPMLASHASATPHPNTGPKCTSAVSTRLQDKPSGLNPQQLPFTTPLV
jgi:outer membrane protein assembly factor BamB